MSPSRPPALGSAPPVLLSDRGCPFAHRVLALLDHLGHRVERTESDIGEKPAGIARYSASGRIPLLVHGDVVVTESRVMLEHLAEYFDFEDAFPSDLATRTLHRHAMAVVDDFLAPRLAARGLGEAELLRLNDVLRALEVATEAAPRPCLLAFHVAPIWLRFRWWTPSGPVTRAIESRPDLCAWLDGAAGLDAVTRTAPDRAAHLAELDRARRAGLLPAEFDADASEHGAPACLTPQLAR